VAIDSIRVKAADNIYVGIVRVIAVWVLREGLIAHSQVRHFGLLEEAPERWNSRTTCTADLVRAEDEVSCRLMRAVGGRHHLSLMASV